jgi:hypothetical protein
MCVSISKEDAAFKSAYFKYYKEDSKEFLARVPFLVNVVIIDPAKTVKKTSAETGFVVWGIDVELGTLYLRYAAGEKLHPDEINDKAISLCLQFGAKVLGIEDTGLSEFATYPLVNEVIRRGLSIEVIPLKARRGKTISGVSGDEAGKVLRIGSLIEYYRRGVVQHNEVGTGAYELQLLSYPRSKRWDIMDAAAYITELLEKGSLYFYGSMTDDSPETVEKEFQEMEKELAAEESGIVYRKVCP